ERGGGAVAGRARRWSWGHGWRMVCPMRREPTVGIGRTRLGETVPGPARDVDSVDALLALQLADRHARQLSVAGPFALAGDHEVQVELVDQPHAVRPRGAVDPREPLV